MINIKQNDEVIAVVPAGGQYRLPNGDVVMPVVAGWSNGDITFEQAPEPVPEAEPTAEELRAAWRQTATMTRTAFCIALKRLSILNPTEAVQAAKGEWPASFAAALEQLPVDEVEAQIVWASVSTIYRTDPVLAAVAAAAQLTPEEVDQMFGWVD